MSIKVLHLGRHLLGIPARNRWATVILILFVAVSAAWIVARQMLNPMDATWQQMQARGTWRIGMDPSFPPFETLDEHGLPIGFDVDLAREIAGQWGLELEIVAMGYDGLLDALQVHRIDAVISALPHDPRLTRDVYFSASYFEAGIRLAVLHDSTITSVEDIGERSVAVEWGSRGDALARRLQREGAAFSRATYSTPDEAIGSLLDGTNQAIFIDGVTLRLAQGAGKSLQAVGPALESDPYVIALPIDAPILQESLEQALKNMQENGQFKVLTERWFGTEW